MSATEYPVEKELTPDVEKQFNLDVADAEQPLQRGTALSASYKRIVMAVGVRSARYLRWPCTF